MDGGERTRLPGGDRRAVRRLLRRARSRAESDGRVSPGSAYSRGCRRARADVPESVADGGSRASVNRSGSGGDQSQTALELLTVPRPTFVKTAAVHSAGESAMGRCVVARAAAFRSTTDRFSTGLRARHLQRRGPRRELRVTQHRAVVTATGGAYGTQAHCALARGR